MKLKIHISREKCILLFLFLGALTRNWTRDPECGSVHWTTPAGAQLFLCPSYLRDAKELPVVCSCSGLLVSQLPKSCALSSSGPLSTPRLLPAIGSLSERHPFPRGPGNCPIRVWHSFSVLILQSDVLCPRPKGWAGLWPRCTPCAGLWQSLKADQPPTTCDQAGIWTRRFLLGCSGQAKSFERAGSEGSSRSGLRGPRPRNQDEGQSQSGSHCILLENIYIFLHSLNWTQYCPV